MKTNAPGTPAEHEIADLEAENAELRRQLKHYRSTIAGTALDWMGKFARAPLWARVWMAVWVGQR